MVTRVVPMTRQAYEYIEFADAQRDAGKYETAGNFYFAASHWFLFRFRHLSTDGDDGAENTYLSTQKLAGWERRILRGVLCYRISGNLARCRNHCEQGILIAEDLHDNERDFGGNWQEAHMGLCHELIGDLRLYGALGDHQAAYDEARGVYETIDNHLGWQAEDEFHALISPLLTFAAAISHEIDFETENTIKNESLLERIDYKKEHYEDIIEQVVENGGW